jgi:hypothetical protein
VPKRISIVLGIVALVFTGCSLGSNGAGADAAALEIPDSGYWTPCGDTTCSPLEYCLVSHPDAPPPDGGLTGPFYDGCIAVAAECAMSNPTDGGCCYCTDGERCEGFVARNTIDCQ